MFSTGVAALLIAKTLNFGKGFRSAIKSGYLRSKTEKTYFPMNANASFSLVYFN